MNQHIDLRNRRASVLVFFAGLASLAAGTALAGMPYCALRDPVHQLYQLFPEAQAYRSVVATVDAGVRESVARQLPFTIHAREIGEHTLYVPLQAQRPVGFLHARTEASPWGLVEIVWALDPMLKIRDFQFQRCRGSACAELTSAEFKARLRGRGLEELRRLLSDDGTAVVPTLHLSPQAGPLALAVIRSALKTIAVTQAVWAAEVRSVQAAAGA